MVEEERTRLRLSDQSLPGGCRLNSFRGGRHPFFFVGNTNMDDTATGLATLACLILLGFWCLSSKPRKHGPVSDADADDTPDEDVGDPERIDL